MNKTCEELRRRLLALRDPKTGVWTGELASSALGTALAAKALADGDAADRALAEAGAAWLVGHVNADGGWGDTPESVSNLSTTLLARAALSNILNRRLPADRVAEALGRTEAWIAERTGTLSPEAIARALGKVYGSDRTFAVPILAFLAMCETDQNAWLSVPPLPFLMALLPRRIYRFFRLQVVSYALPALIAVGFCRHVRVARARGRWAWGSLFAGALLRRLERLQPSHGGFLDAVPLTAFVCLALRHAGYEEHPAAQKGLDFVRRSARADGSWAIDSNLRTWVTTLATRGVAGRLEAGESEKIAEWLVGTQVKGVHPFTGARPGGWAWTDLPGGVPDADDTAGALIALKRLKEAGCRTEVRAAVQSGVNWLLGLQNRDGGMPTFCRGWGRLPFDRSCPDISAHALAALAAWNDAAREDARFPWSAGAAGGRASSRTVGKAIQRLILYLERAQAPDGSWTPLWFGHQETADGKNPVVGTARVVDALRGMPRESGVGRREACGIEAMLARGKTWLVRAQHADGGWGMGNAPTVEETALSVIALAGGGAAGRGCAWLMAQGVAGLERTAPIGLYFSLLWYHERLYPLVWALEALGKNVNEKEDDDGRRSD